MSQSKLIELIKSRDELYLEIKRIEAENKLEEERKKRNLYAEFIINKDFILKLLKHERNNCSDENPINGFDSSGSYRCSKCAMIEALNRKDDSSFGYTWDFDLDVTVFREKL